MRACDAGDAMTQKKPDWRDSSTYDYLDDLSAEELAWECLRRNPAYRASYDALIEAGDDDALDEAAKSWGLRFRR
jgi:hypothetical protein